MRMFILKQGQDLQTLSSRLGGSASISRLKALNPHLDLDRLEPGTVLLVPDGIDDADSVAGAVFDGLAGDVKEGLKAATARVRGTQAKSEALRKDVSAILKSAAFKRAVESDADLKKQTDAADARFKADQAKGKQTEESLSALEQLVNEELAVLGKLVR
jgi:vacuolar-type H+-ATPase subunit I/STV1